MEELYVEFLEDMLEQDEKTFRMIEAKDAEGEPDRILDTSDPLGQKLERLAAEDKWDEIDKILDDLDTPAGREYWKKVQEAAQEEQEIAEQYAESNRSTPSWKNQFK